MSLLTRRSSSCRYIYSTNTPQRKEPWLTERRESTLTASHICHRPCIPFRHVLIERRCTPKHCKRGCNKEKKDHNPPQTTKKVPFQNKKVTKRVRIVIRWNSSCRIFNNTPQRKAPWSQREREGTLTVFHSCHRPRIPVGHVLIERLCVLKHCKKREGCNKKRKTKPTTQVPYQTTNIKKE